TEISLLNLITGEETKGADLLPSVYPGFMAINHELSYLAVWDRKTVSLWKLPDVYLEKVFVITDSDTQGLAGPILFSPDDKLLLAAGYSPNEILFWNVETGQFLHSIPVSETALELGYHIVMSPDGRLLATMGNDGTIRIWGVKK
ncbi:MAG TPA: hypothetical protein VFQ13_17210, partial [Anaerolineales bacterium]|nr:hypothetical protein [Anaerolineales bacterium]